MTKFMAAVIQLNSQEKKDYNVLAALSFIEEASAAGARLVCLPEYFNFLGRNELKTDAAESMADSTISTLIKKAVEKKIWIHGGSILEKGACGGKFWNTSVLISPEGQIAAKYRKIHLFDITIPGSVSNCESETICPGNEVVLADMEYGRIGFTICYDLRFPELYRKLAYLGADIITVPAAFTLQTGKDHWEVLLRARAIENQVYIIAPGQIGAHPPEKFCFGNSMIVDPWGTVVARCSNRPGWAAAEIHLEFRQEVKRNVPCFNHVRPDLYQL